MSIAADLDFTTNAGARASAAVGPVEKLAAAFERLHAAQTKAQAGGAGPDPEIAKIRARAAAQEEVIAAREASSIRIAQARAAAAAETAAQRASQQESILGQRTAAQAQKAAQQEALVGQKAGAQAEAAAARDGAELRKIAARQSAAIEASNAKGQAQFQLAQQKAVNQAVLSGQKAGHQERMAQLRAESELKKIQAKQTADIAKIEAKAKADAGKAKSRPSGGGAAANDNAGGGFNGQFNVSGLAQLGGASAGMAGAAAAIVSAVAMLASMLGGLVKGGIELALSATSFKRNAILGLASMLGGAEQAKAMYGQIAKFADTSPFKTQDVTKHYKKLLGAGFAGGETQEILKGLYDVSALNDFDTQVVDRMSLAFGQIKGKGKLQTEELNQIVEGSGGTISRLKVFEQLAKMTGKSTDEIDKQLQKGKISADVGIKAIMEVIRTGVSGGKLGSLMQKMGSESFVGLVSTIASKLTGLFDSVKIDPFLDGLKSVATVLLGPIGEKLKTSVTSLMDGIFEALFAGVSGMGGDDAIGRLVNGIADGIATVAVVIKAIAPYVAAFVSGMIEGFGNVGSVITQVFGRLDMGKAEASANIMTVIAYAAKGLVYAIVAISAALVIVMGFLGGFMGVMGALMGVLMTVIGIVGDLASVIVETLGSAFDLGGLEGFVAASIAIGMMIPEGIAAGVASAAGAVISAVIATCSSALAAAKAILGIHSPSDVFDQEVGQMGGEGVARGFDKSSGGASAAAAGMADDAASAASAAMGKGGKNKRDAAGSDQSDAGGGGKGGKGGDSGMFAGATLNIHASGEEEGKKAARGFYEELRQLGMVA